MLPSTPCFQARRTTPQRHEPNGIPSRYSIYATRITYHVTCLPNSSTAIIIAAPFHKWLHIQYWASGKPEDLSWREGKKSYTSHEGAPARLSAGIIQKAIAKSRRSIFFFKITFERISKCACYLGLHYATRAAPPDPLPHQQEHDGLWHVSMGAHE